MSNCPHINTIDVGDDEHHCLACTDCEKILGYPDTQNSDLCPECGATLFVKKEIRDGGNSETVGYCQACGYTETG